MSKIEEVAKAYRDAVMSTPDGVSIPFEEFSRIAARAAIEAMREPTDAMMKAGEVPGWDDSVSIGLSSDVWRAMIDAALNEVKG